jgi:hypothetical protein
VAIAGAEQASLARLHAVQPGIDNQNRVRAWIPLADHVENGASVAKPAM